jgi:hypothetical protein
VHEAREQKAALMATRAVDSEMRQSPPQILYAHQFTRQGVYNSKLKPFWPKWLLDLIGEDFFLRVVGISFDGHNTTDDDVRAIIKLHHLRELDLEYTKITDAGLALVAEHFPKLTRLDLQETRVTPFGLKHLTQLDRLKHLLFGKCDIEDEHLAALESLEHLEHLALRRTKVRGEGLEYLVRLPNLRSLDLDRTLLTDAALRPLSQLSQLKDLKLTGTGLSREAIDQLRWILPRCKIIADER